MDCCSRHGCDEVFGRRFVRRTLRRYRRKGLDETARAMAGWVTADGVAGASVLEIGGGIGGLQLELLKAGAASGTVVEVVGGYREAAEELARELGVAARSEFRLADLVAEPDAVEPADWVLMHRVVCCTPQGVELAGVAAGLARRGLVFSYPRQRRALRAFARVVNGLQRLRRRDFRFHVHAPSDLHEAAMSRGLTPSHVQTGRVWEVAAFRRA